MRYVFGVLIVAALLVFVVGTVRGRVRVRSCCPDPRSDLRMRAAFADEDPDPTGRDVSPGRPSDGRGTSG